MIKRLKKPHVTSGNHGSMSRPGTLISKQRHIYFSNWVYTPCTGIYPICCFSVLIPSCRDILSSTQVKMLFAWTGWNKIKPDPRLGSFSPDSFHLPWHLWCVTLATHRPPFQPALPGIASQWNDGPQDQRGGCGFHRWLPAAGTAYLWCLFQSLLATVPGVGRVNPQFELAYF